MPKLGLGTWRMRGAACTDAVLSALARGYRHIDTAQMYGNEDAVGAALAATGVPRADIHVTTKVWWENLAPGRDAPGDGDQPAPAADRTMWTSI